MPASPASPPRQIGPTVWMTCPAGRRYPRVSRASPGGQPPSVRHSASSSGPAARWIAPSTPPPPSSEVLAALTIASTVSRVMSPNSIRIRSRGISSLAIARPVEKQERPSPLSGRSNWPSRIRSSADLLAEIAAEQLLVEDDAVAVIKGDLARLVGIGQSASFRQRLFAADEAGARFAFSFLGHDPTLFRRMDSIDMASQHDPSRECDGFSAQNLARDMAHFGYAQLDGLGSPTRRRHATFPDLTGGTPQIDANRGQASKKNGTGVSRSRKVCGWQTRDRETLPNRTRV